MKTNIIGKKRYSDYNPGYGTGAPTPEELGLSDDNDSSSSASGLFNWGIVDKLITTTGTVLSNIYGTGDKYRASALQEINEQQQKTTAILWVVIGLMAALGVVLLIRKTK